MLRSLNEFRAYLVHSVRGDSVHLDAERAMTQAANEGGTRIPLVPDLSGAAWGAAPAYLVYWDCGEKTCLKQERAQQLADEHHGKCVPLVVA